MIHLSSSIWLYMYLPLYKYYFTNIDYFTNRSIKICKAKNIETHMIVTSKVHNPLIREINNCNIHKWKLVVRIFTWCIHNNFVFNLRAICFLLSLIMANGALYLLANSFYQHVCFSTWTEICSCHLTLTTLTYLLLQVSFMSLVVYSFPFCSVHD